MSWLRCLVLLVAAFAWLLPLSPASAVLTSTGRDPAKVPDPILTESLASGCGILWYRFFSGEPEEVERLQAFGHAITESDSKTDLALSNLLNYGVLVLAYTPAGVISEYQADIQAFVQQGGGLLIHQPNIDGAIDYAPVNLGATLGLAPCYPFMNPTQIDDGSHPVTLGLVDADLSGGFDQVTSLGTGYTPLASTPNCGVALAAGTSGLGRVVFETGNASPTSVDPGSERYWDQVFGWLCTFGPVPVEGSSWGGVKAAYR